MNKIIAYKDLKRRFIEDPEYKQFYYADTQQKDLTLTFNEWKPLA